MFIVVAVAMWIMLGSIPNIVKLFIAMRHRGRIDRLGELFKRRMSVVWLDYEKCWAVLDVTGQVVAQHRDWESAIYDATETLRR